MTTITPAIAGSGIGAAYVAAEKVPLPVNGDPVRLEQIVTNLLTNAIKYTPRGGRIEVEVSGHGGQALLRVRDNGIGIPPAMLERIFELFTQEESSRSRSEGGLGLGLPLVKELVTLHGGTVQVRSEGKGKGSEFTVRLPVDKGGPKWLQPPGGSESHCPNPPPVR